MTVSRPGRGRVSSIAVCDVSRLECSWNQAVQQRLVKQFDEERRQHVNAGLWDVRGD